MKTLRVPLRVVFYREGDVWIAHCLEFDLLGDGPTKDDAVRSLGQAICLQVAVSIEHGNHANLFSPADGRYLEMFAAGKDIAEAALEVNVFAEIREKSPMIEDIELREYVGFEAEAGIDSGCALV